MSDAVPPAMPAPAVTEPLSLTAGSEGVLVLHGFTGNPFSMRGIADAFFAAGWSVELPLLPGHGSSLEEILASSWADWCSATAAAYEALCARCRKVVVVGLSMGGTLACWLAVSHPELAGMVLVNPFIEPPAPSAIEILEGMLAGGVTVIPSIGSDIKLPHVSEPSAAGTPIAPLLSLFSGMQELSTRLGEIAIPVLLFSSREDHVVPPSSGDYLVARVAGEVERVFLEQSYHVATLDYDREEIERASVAFGKKVVG